MKSEQLRINPRRLMERLDTLAAIGATADGSCCRLALTDEDKAGRDLVVGWMRELGLEVRIDPVGNIFGLRQGRESADACAPVMTGSHIDTVRTGGRYDGNLGVLGGLEVVQTLNDAGITTRRPLVVGAFTDEEGARFHPDMAGSLAYVGGMPLEELYATRGIDGKVFKDELVRIGYLGDAPMPLYRPHAYVELHIEQGPVLDIEGITIGAVEDLQGISWTEVLDHRPVEPRGHDADAAAARRRLLRGRHRHLRAAAREGTRRRAGRHGGLDHAASEPDERDRRARARHRGPAQHRRRRARRVGAAAGGVPAAARGATKA